MKTKNSQCNYCLIFIAAVFLFAGCAKETTTKVETTSNSTSQTAIAKDDMTLADVLSQAVDDAVTIICNHKASLGAGVTVDTLTYINSGVFEIGYAAENAAKTIGRLGNDSIHMAMVGGKIAPWSVPEAVATVTLSDANGLYEVQLPPGSPNGVNLSGTVSITNLYGGLLQNLAAGDSLVVELRASLKYTLSDNAATIKYNPWNINIIRVYTLSGTTLNATIRADTIVDGFKNISDWGTDVFGNTFYSTVTSPIVQNISDVTLSYNPISGGKVIEGIAEPISCTYGVNNQGAIISTGTPYGFNIGWINGGGQDQAVVPYYY